MRIFKGFISVPLAFFLVIGVASLSVAEDKTKSEDLQKLSQEASNPVGQLWMLNNQFNLYLLQSDNVKLFQEHKNQFVWNFQPIMPIGITESVRVIVRPIIPLESVPAVSGRTDIEYKFGFGDIGIQTILAPNTDALTGFMWGVGPIATFPTAGDKALGKGKWQLGAAAAAVYITDKWVVGAYPQHWWSVAGDESRSNVSFTNIQYFLWYSPFPTWQIGMGPNVTIDWEQKKAEDRLTLPVGLGVSKIFRLGKLPIKMAFEVDYSVVRPRNIPGNEWTFRINFTPIIRSLL
jgi:hypothetical protein